MKTCTKCRETKSRDQFYKMSRNTDGKDPYCITCRKQVSKEYNKNNRKKLNEYQNKYYQANKERIRETARLREQARKNNV